MNANFAALRGELIAYAQEALDDARARIRQGFEDNLSPFSDLVDDPAAHYPGMLNRIALQGYLRETLAGLAVEHFGAVGKTDWQVPAFLFRFHDQEFQHLDLINERMLTGEAPDPDAESEKRPGRTGDDALAFMRLSGLPKYSNGFRCWLGFAQVRLIASTAVPIGDRLTPGFKLISQPS
ncbi:hypothetical protein ACFFJ7_20730 [Pseudochelatococcus lubricantis]